MRGKSEGGFGFWGKRAPLMLLVAGAAGIFPQTTEVGKLEIALLRPVLAAFITGAPLLAAHASGSANSWRLPLESAISVSFFGLYPQLCDKR